VFDPFTASVENLAMLLATCQENFLQSALVWWGNDLDDDGISSIGNGSNCWVIIIGLIFGPRKPQKFVYHEISMLMV